MAISVELLGITKVFLGVVANDHIDFSAKESEIHGLLGENGAGKTVLMNILYGLSRPDEGKILVKGEEVVMDSPAKAMKLGIGMVHQHFMLVPSLTVVENIILGREQIKRGVFLDEEKMLKDVQEFCDLYNIDVNLEVPIHTLSVGLQQRVEILKALYRGADILILDEPTAVLTPQEVEELFKAIRTLKDEGKTVIFISHKLREVLAICDRVTVLKKGRVVGTVEVNETDISQLAEMMVGREIFYTYDIKQCKADTVILSVEDLKADNDRGLQALRGVDLQVCASEIMGLAGVEGNGQTELVEVIMGLRKANGGRVLLEDNDITTISTEKRIKAGISHIPEDRHKWGLIKDFTVLENLILGKHKDSKFTRSGGRIDFHKAAEYSEELVRDYSIQTPSVGTSVSHLSGGTQQRVIVAREFSRKPKLIIASQPTRGLDIGATEYVRSKLVEMRNKGSAVLLVSADLDEIWALSDRIAVIYEGMIVAIKDSDETSKQELGLLMAGGNFD